MKSTILRMFIISSIVSICFSIYVTLFVKNDTRFPPMSRATWDKLGEIPEKPEPVEKNVPPEVVIQGYTNL